MCLQQQGSSWGQGYKSAMIKYITFYFDYKASYKMLEKMETYSFL